jgi:hypothetical protein
MILNNVLISVSVKWHSQQYSHFSECEVTFSTIFSFHQMRSDILTSVSVRSYDSSERARNGTPIPKKLTLSSPFGMECEPSPLLLTSLLAYCTSPGWWTMVSVEQSLEWLDRGNGSTRRKPALVPLCPPQIPDDLTRARIRAAAVGSRRLTAWAKARLSLILNTSLIYLGVWHNY